MMNASSGRVGAAILASALACGPVAAATFTYDLTVTESIDAIIDIDGVPTNFYDLPDLGTTGTLTIDLAVDGSNAGDPIPPEGVDISGILTVSATFGNLSTGLDPAFAQIRPRPGRAQFRNGEFSALAVTLLGAPSTGTLAGSFSVSSAAFGGGLPATLGDVLTILSAPDAFAFLSFNGTAASRSVVFAAEETAPVAVVPLPAGGLLLLSGLAWLAAARRR